MNNFVKRMSQAVRRAQTWYWIGGGIAVLLIVCGLCVAAGWYPIALVDGHPIWAGAFYEAYQSGYTYWSDMLRAQQGSMVTPHIQNTIRGLAFEGAIDEYLIMRKLERDIGTATLVDKIQSAQQDASSDAALQQTLSKLGMSGEREVDYFIRQTAEYNLLDGDVRLENTTAAQWLFDARKQARVVVLMPGYHWTGSGITVANTAAAK